MTRRPSQAGFTLVELLVATGIGLIAAAGAMTLFVGQQRAIQALDLVRQMNEASRDAMLELEGSLRRAGWGIDPRRALDFRAYDCPASPGTCRDGRDGPDEIVFVSRNPYYRWRDFADAGCATLGGCLTGNAWPIESLSATAVTTTLREGDRLHKGRVLQLVCANGQNATFVTVDKAVDGPGQVGVQIMAAAAGDPYRENAFTLGCFLLPGAAIYLVDRVHYQVVAFDNVPWLVLDNGLDLDGDGVTPENLGDLEDLVPIAPGIEDLQVAWAYNPSTTVAATDTNRNWVVGDDPAAVAPEEPDPTLPGPTYMTGSNDPSRFNLHPANVRAARITLSVRSLRPDSGRGALWQGDPALRVEDRSATNLPSTCQRRPDGTCAGGYRRLRASATVMLRNLDSRSPFMF